MVIYLIKVIIKLRSGIIQLYEPQKCQWMVVHWSLGQDVKLYLCMVTFILITKKLLPNMVSIIVSMIKLISTYLFSSNKHNNFLEPQIMIIVTQI